MSKFKVGDKVRVRFDAVVMRGNESAFFWVEREGGGSVLLADEWAEKVLPVLPTAEGSVIKVTRWAGREQAGWVALLRNGGSWAISVDQESSYGPKHLQDRLSKGMFDFEVLFDASKEENA